MAKNLGTFTFAANFQVKAAEALDPRTVAASKADLINKANWPSDGDTIYVYKGLIVDCGEDGVYAGGEISVTVCGLGFQIECRYIVQLEFSVCKIGIALCVKG